MLTCSRKIVFTLVVVGFSIKDIKLNNGMPYHIVRLVLEYLIVLKWFVLWVLLAESVANVGSEGATTGLMASMGVETAIAVIQWYVSCHQMRASFLRKCQDRLHCSSHHVKHVLA